ncbi:hypothetical protein GCK32_010314, partial [Trichostrongylus colubriformis]
SAGYSVKKRSWHVTSARQYQCIASWNEDKSIYMFAVRGQETHSCFVSSYMYMSTTEVHVAEYSSGRLYLASTGTHCIRNFSFSEHSDKTIVLEEEAGCATPQKLKPSRKPAGPVTKSSPTALVDASSENASSHSLPVSKSAIDGPQWATGPTSVATRTRNIFLFTVICMHYIIF